MFCLLVLSHLQLPKEVTVTDIQCGRECLMFFRNLLQIPNDPPPSGHSRDTKSATAKLQPKPQTGESASTKCSIHHEHQLHHYNGEGSNKIIWNLFTNKLDSIIIGMTCSPHLKHWCDYRTWDERKDYWLHILTCCTYYDVNELCWWFCRCSPLLQLIAVIYKDQHVKNLERLLNLWFEMSDSSEDNESNTSPAYRSAEESGSGEELRVNSADQVTDDSSDGASNQRVAKKPDVGQQQQNFTSRSTSGFKDVDSKSELSFSSSCGREVRIRCGWDAKRLDLTLVSREVRYENC